MKFAEPMFEVKVIMAESIMDDPSLGGGTSGGFAPV